MCFSTAEDLKGAVAVHANFASLPNAKAAKMSKAGLWALGDDHGACVQPDGGLVAWARWLWALLFFHADVIAILPPQQA